MGWGEKAIEVRSVETGLLDGVFMHKRAQTFRFLCERNEKVSISTYGYIICFIIHKRFWQCHSVFVSFLFMLSSVNNKDSLELQSGVFVVIYYEPRRIPFIPPGQAPTQSVTSVVEDPLGEATEQEELRHSLAS